MDTKRCRYCHKLARAEAETCGRCGHSFAKNEHGGDRVVALPSNKGKQKSIAGEKRNREVAVIGTHKMVPTGETRKKTPVLDTQQTLMSLQQRSIPPASPHRAGHYSGLHPEDQPYQSTIMAAQSAELAEQEAERIILPPIPGAEADEATEVTLPPLRRFPLARPYAPSINRDGPGSGESAYQHSLHGRSQGPASRPSSTLGPTQRRHFRPFVKTGLTISFLLLLVASSLLAYMFINRRPAPDKQVLNVLPNQVRVNDTITLLGGGFGTNDLISFIHDKQSQPLFNGNGKALQARADDLGNFSVQVVVPTNWAVGQHHIYAIDVGKEQSVSVLATLTILQSSSAPPSLQLVNSKLDLGIDVPGVVSKKDVMLINAGGRQLTWQASSDQPWLTVSPNNGTFSGGTLVEVTVNRGTLPPQPYTGRIKFRQQGSSDDLLLTVRMAVKAAPPASLTISPVSLTYSATTSQNPADQVVTLQNNASQPLNWSSAVVTGDGTQWLSISPAQGHLEAHSSTTITASVQSLQLAVGSYQGTISFKGGTNPPVTVVLNVVAPGNLIASPPFLNFTSLGQNPASQTITLQNSGGSPIDWSVSAATVDGVNWLSATPVTGHLEPNQSATVAISVNAATLKPRSYQGTLIFTYGSLTKQVSVSLTVSTPPAAAIGLNASTLNFTTMKGTNPAAQAFTISNTGNATLNWAITEDQNGQSFAPVSSSRGSLAPTKSVSITVIPNVSQAAAGTLTTTITVMDSDAGTKVVGQKLVVSIVVEDQPAITLSTNQIGFSHDNLVTDSSQLLVITNTGSQPLNWVVHSSSTWLSSDITSGVLDPGQRVALDVGCNSTGLPAGNYTASLVISDSDAGTQVISQTVNVTVVVN